MSGLRRLSKKSKRFLIVQKMHQLVRTHDRKHFSSFRIRATSARSARTNLDLLVRLKGNDRLISPCAYPYTVAQDSSRHTDRRKNGRSKSPADVIGSR